MAGRLEGKVAIVTGGASGIGEGTVRRFVEEGAKCIIADIQTELAKSLADDLGGDAVPFSLDVADEDLVNACVDFAVKEFEQRKAAFQYTRATTAKTGRLDVNKLWSYKTSEDIFSYFLKLKKLNKAIIFATHNRELANKADYKLSISKGNIKRANAR
mgnify:CR=1 FL=1